MPRHDDQAPGTAGAIPLPTGYRCVTCGEWHEGPALAVSIAAPSGWSDDLLTTLPGSLLTSDVCVIKHENGSVDRFVRGVLPIPINGTGEEFQYGVWTSLSETSFARYRELWERDPKADEPAWFGWLSSALDYEPPTLNLKLSVHPQAAGQRPVFWLEQSSDHPLAVEQREGMSVERWIEIVSKVLH